MKKSQAWSMDIMLAIVIFIGTILIFYSVLTRNTGSSEDELKEDAIRLEETLNITQNISQIEELLNEKYPELKKELRIDSDFCIFLEDEEGNIIYLRQGTAGVGSDKISISGEPCESG